MAYDPVYAHEYYMKHRELKGRKKSRTATTDTSPKRESTANRGLSKEQKAELKSYWEGLKADLAEEKEAINEAKRQTIEKLNEKMSADISKLRQVLKKLRGSNSDTAKAMIRKEIEKLQQTKKDTRDKIVSSAKEMYSSAKNKAYSKYNSKLNSMAKK